MSKQPNEKSSVASDPEDGGSVYDFLYHDARRVGSFLAQLEPDGHLQSLKRTVQASRAQQRTSGAKGGLHVGIGQAALEGAGQASSTSAQTSDRTYDPLWANATALLDLLDQRSLISRSIKQRAVGSLVVMTGLVKVMNVKMLSSILHNPEVSKILEVNNVADDAANRNQQAMMLQVMKAFPATVQAHFVATGEEPSVSWMALDEANMVVSPSNLLLNYGPWLDGEWSVLGIKDADPDGGVSMETLSARMNENLEEKARENHSTPLAYFAELLGPTARYLMGRPGNFFGLTPILIFREVATGAE